MIPSQIKIRNFAERSYMGTLGGKGLILSILACGRERYRIEALAVLGIAAAHHTCVTRVSLSH